MRTVLVRLRALFLSGLIVVLPAVITLYVLSFLFQFLDSLIGRFVYPYLPFPIPGLGLVLTLAIILLIGALARNLIGRSMIHFTDSVLTRTPIVRNVYSTIKQIVDTMMVRRQGGFQRVGLIEYPRRGLYCYVFVTSNGQAEAEIRTGHSLVSVFLPTTPNPTSGFLLLVPKEDIIYLDMSVEDAVKVIISAGLVVPETARPAAVKEMTADAGQ